MATSNWLTYWKDTKTAPIERLVQWWKEKYGYGRIAELITSDNILEVGTGKGCVSSILRADGRAVTTSDIHKTDDIDYEIDAKNILFPPNFFDATMSTGLMEHFDDTDFMRMLNQQMRVSRDNVWIIIPEKSIWWNILWGIRRMLGAKLELHFNMRNEDEVKRLIKTSGNKCTCQRVMFGFLFPYLVLRCWR